MNKLERYWKCLTCKKQVGEDRDVCEECLERVIWANKKKYLKEVEEMKQKVRAETKTDILKKVEACLLFPFEGTLDSGKELERPKILDIQREAFNRIVRGDGDE